MSLLVICKFVCVCACKSEYRTYMCVCLFVCMHVCVFASNLVIASVCVWGLV